MLIDELEQEIHYRSGKYKGGQRKGGGYAQLAKDMNIRASTFYNKLNPEESTKSLNQREQFKVIKLLEDDDPASVEYIKELIAEIMGGRFVPQTSRVHTSLQTALMKADEARHGVAAEILKALANDGVIDEGELARINLAVFNEEIEGKSLIATAKAELGLVPKRG